MPHNSRVGDIYYNNAIAQKTDIRKQTEKSINSLFERNIITAQQKDDLLNKYLSGEISFGEDGLTENEANNFTKDDYEKINNNLKNNIRDSKENSNTPYIIQPGDTPEKIAEKLGYTGVEAKNFATKIKANAINDGLYYKFGFKTGDMIILPGNFEQEISNLKNTGNYLETDAEINNSYIDIRKQQRSEADQESSANKNQTSHKKTQISQTDINKYENLKQKSINIRDALSKNPSIKNKNLSNLNSENVALVLMLYNQKTGRSLAQDIINNGDHNFAKIKNNICWNLAKRAQELNLTGIYFKDYMNMNDEKKLVSWIQNAQDKIIEAETKKNPAFKKVFSDRAERHIVRENDLTTTRKNASKIAKDLNKEINPDFELGLSETWAYLKKSSSNDGIINVLEKITPETVAFVVEEFKKESNKNITFAIDDEIGLDMSQIKKYICKNLVTQAKKLGLTGIYYSSYENINDINSLNSWVESISKKIRNAEINNSKYVRTEASSQIRTKTETKNGVTSETISNHPLFKEGNISKVVENYDKNNYKINSMYYFKDSKVIKEGYVASYTNPITNKKEIIKNVIISQNKNGEFFVKDKNGIELSVQQDENGQYFTLNNNKCYIVKRRELIKKGENTKAEDVKIYEPLPLKIKLPDNANNNAKDFAKALENNKEALMKELKIDSDTYNRLAILAMAIAENETNFGINEGPRAAKYPVAAIDSISGGVVNNFLRELSFGPTQIKYDVHKKDSKIAELFESFGIKHELQLYQMDKSAIATLIILAVNDSRLKQNKNIQNGIEAANGVIVEEKGWEIQKGHASKTYNTKPWINNVTQDDALCYSWNQGNRQILNGTMTPELNAYTRNVRKYKEKYSIIEDKSLKKEAIEKAFVQNIKPLDNNGPIGSIAFMPKMYSYSEFKNINSTVQILENSLKNNPKIDDKSKNLLLLAVKNREIAFEFGLKKAEADSLTQKDVDLLLSHLSKLKNNLENKNKNIKFSDGINSSENYIMKNQYMDLIKKSELEFKKAYLGSLSPTISTSSIPKENILNNPLNNNLDYSIKKHRRGFAGDVHNEIDDKGVNTASTNDTSYTLAKFAQTTVEKMKSAGKCMTGFRQAIREAGINDTDLVEGTPRGSVNWFERHPEMFEEVNFINIGNNKARQINSTDLPNLPAGYIVVWIPSAEYTTKEKGYEPGHISITNGNGQAYADETDNLDWGVYHSSKNSGKGEHGTFRVFRLTNNWTVDQKTGKLKFCK